MSTTLDPDGQPLDTRYNENYRIARALNELAGLVRGIVADGYVHSAETKVLAQWLAAHREVKDSWQVRRLAERMALIYRDGIADEEERADLKILLEQMVGRFDENALLYTPTQLPLTHPEPEVVFDSNEFVLTGKFLYGTRKRCEREIQIRGGTCADTVRLRTSYLVIGSLVSRDWKCTSYGSKIEKAVEYSKLCPIAVICEKRWQEFLMDDVTEPATVLNLQQEIQ
jgi:NAD-dependent DNA ligase